METPLSAYMKRHAVSDATFASLIRKDRTLVNRLKRGLVRPTLDLAAEIEAQTNGEVPIKAWVASRPQAAA